MEMDVIYKPMVAAMVGLGSAVLEMTVPMFVLTGGFVLADVVTAVRLQRRMVAAGKIDKGEARISSRKFGRLMGTLGKIMGLLVLTSMADYLVLESLGIPAMKMVAGAICFWQAISLLENEAAENDAKWAVYARRFLVDKAKKELGIRN